MELIVEVKKVGLLLKALDQTSFFSRIVGQFSYSVVNVK